MCVKYVYTSQGMSFKVSELDLLTAKQWDEEIQPLIDSIGGRSDEGWRWRRWYALSIVFNIILNQDAKAFSISYRNVLIGMFFGVFNYKCKDENIDVSSFLWLVSKNPELDTILDMIETKKGFRPKVYFIDMVFDIILKESIIRNSNGSFWLHASPDGNDPKKLLNFYIKKGLKKCKMSRLTLARKDDGRYLYSPEDRQNKIHLVEIEQGGRDNA